MGFLDKIFRFDQRRLKKIEKESKKVIAYEETMRGLSDEELKAKTPYFRERLAKGDTLDDIKHEAFAVAREAAQRTLGQFPYPVQIMGALVLHDGDVAEMKTGEGKTLTATMAVYLNALAGNGVHVVTVNEYLASRDADWMGQIYRFLGLTVGVNLREKTVTEKQEAYNSDITYTTNSEVGFDYLRDNMATSLSGRVLRGLEFAIVDEADSILIDESRTPLIISGGAKASVSAYNVADRFVKTLRRDKHFVVDIKTKTANLTDEGNNLAERMFGVRNIYDPQYADLVHRIHQALKANHIMTRDVEYMVDSENEIQLIDQFTGRVLRGREYSDGLQQAIQAKEGVKIKQETVTMATITYQNFFRLYKKLSGMTGTAKTEEEEFRKIYNMRVICIPTNRPVIRIDAIDRVYAKKEYKLKALLEEVIERHEKGQPLLIGTSSVESSEEVSALLSSVNLKHEVLNAKNHAREAEIIAKAGQVGQITIATNMAGRGTDIKISDEVKALGGLAVLGTERYEARRIDNQLRGRAGRQGDAGYSRFYVSFDDELMLRFASDAMLNLVEKLGDEPLENKMFTNAITSAQKRIEGQNFDTRKNLLDYDDVLAKQRAIMYRKRDAIIYAKDIHDLIQEQFALAGQKLASRSAEDEKRDKFVDGEKLKKIVEPQFLEENTIKVSAYDDSPVDEVGEDLTFLMYKRYLNRRKSWNEEIALRIERDVTLRAIDRNWTRHIDTMDHLRGSIYLRSYANTNPLQDYVNEGYALFKEMMDTIAIEVVLNLLNVQVRVDIAEEENQGQGELDGLKTN
ncbi:MAG: preprotein translocase subunit SecA [Erysipelotrichaceae bacterium]|jgi:preprotein translocase subunit SecA|nr:preprotein translocase subunit SecA [Bacilli bacterium]NLJ32478.1 preprotein translocase subunit SecA [Erysipelotrichaceae bacterium]